MADETEKKPEFVLNKKEKKPEEAQKTATEHKKVVVIRRKPSVAKKSADPAPTGNQNTIRVVAKKSPDSSEKPVEEKKSTDAQKISEGDVKKQPVETKKAEDKTAKDKTVSQKNDSAPKTTEQKPRIIVKHNPTFEINSARPNVKAGNLSGNPRGRYNNHREGGSGFTGAQAREGYQNRERENQNGTGGYQIGRASCRERV